MNIRSFADLVTPDVRTLRFTPLGLSTGGMLTPETAAEFQQQVIASADLTPDVPESVRSSFERLRTLHSYGVLCYEAFTVAQDLSWLVMEQALRERFITYYNGCIPVVNAKDGAEATITAQSFDDVYDAVTRGGAYVKDAWKLRVLATGELMAFRASLSDLRRWARREGLLHGQRNKRMEWVDGEIRNAVAHPSGYHLVMPVDSARTICDLAEFINRLWGELTTGSRLYPAPIKREVLVIAWAEGEFGPKLSRFRADQLASFDDDGDWTYVVVRAVGDDESLWEFDAQFERTTFPSELLWGPGGKQPALAWLEAEQPSTDVVSHLDRLFVMQVHAGKVYLARRPEIALSLPVERQHGDWRAVRADYPNDALAHVRHVRDGVSCISAYPRQACPVEEMFEGRWNELKVRLEELCSGIQPARLSTVRVPRRWPLPPDLGED